MPGSRTRPPTGSCSAWRGAPASWSCSPPWRWPGSAARAEPGPGGSPPGSHLPVLDELGDGGDGEDPVVVAQGRGGDAAAQLVLEPRVAGDGDPLADRSA